MKRKIIIIMIVLVILIVLAIAIAFGINAFVVNRYKNKILSVEDSKELENVDCILILGAQVIDDKPSEMLEDRLKQGLELYNNGISNKIIVSGDHGRTDYDEVRVMKDYLISDGVPCENIFMDHAGFSTYDSMYRAKNIFKVEKLVVVTQSYHLYRAIYSGNKLGVDTYGVSSDLHQYGGQEKREVREILARNKDFVMCIFKPQAKFGGEDIPISGNGDITND